MDLGLLLRRRFGPALGNRLAQFVAVELGEPFDDFAADQALLDDFRDVVHVYARIPDPIGVNHDVGAVTAGAERTAGGDVNFSLQFVG
ncbi:MAG TPA: hypothetical protein VJ733_08380 [Candidatus Binatia bacterium]|nr:hypothetical protein [Candidatus Binatia bacterium]